MDGFPSIRKNNMENKEISEETKIAAREMYFDALKMRAEGRVFLGDVNWESKEDVQRAARAFKEGCLIELTPDEVVEAAKACSYLYDLGCILEGKCQ